MQPQSKSKIGTLKRKREKKTGEKQIIDKWDDLSDALAQAMAWFYYIYIPEWRTSILPTKSRPLRVSDCCPPIQEARIWAMSMSFCIGTNPPNERLSSCSNGS